MRTALVSRLKQIHTSRFSHKGMASLKKFKWAIFEFLNFEYCIEWAISKSRNFHALSSLTSLWLSGWYTIRTSVNIAAVVLNSIIYMSAFVWYSFWHTSSNSQQTVPLLDFFMAQIYFLSQAFPFSMRDGWEDHETVACCVGWAAQGTTSSQTHLNITSLWCGRLYTLKTPLYFTGHSWNTKTTIFIMISQTNFIFL
jgi:hypothetical protein